MCNCILCLTSGGAQCCAIWSAMSVLFLVFAGLVMSTPPVFIKDVSEEQAKVGAHNAFVAAGMYGATTFLAIFMYMHRSRQERTKIGKMAPKQGEVGLSDDTFSAPLVESTGVATSARANDTAASSTTGTKKKKPKSKPSEALTSI